MKSLFLCLALVVGLSACVPKVMTPMGKMTESAYVQIETVKAVTAQNSAQVACFQAAGTIGGADTLDPAIASVNAMGKVAAINGCASGASMQQTQIPQYVPPRSGWEVAADFGKTVVQIGVPGFVAVKQSGDARDVALGAQNAGVLIAQSSDRREAAIMQSAVGSNQAIAGSGFTAIGSVATGSNDAMAQAITAANTASAANVAALANMVTKLPPTIQAGGSVTQAGGSIDQSQNGANRVNGSGNETARNILCTANGGNAAATLGGLTASTVGATSALNPGYNPIISIVPAPTSNNCGGG